MRPLLKILTATTVVLFAAAVAGVVVLKSVDPDRYRGPVADEVESLTGRKLTIAGDLDLKISLNPSIVIENAALANAAWASRTEMATVKRLEVKVELIPLFSGNVRVTLMRLEGLDLLLETDSKGLGNWEFSTSSRKETEPRTADSGERTEAASTAPETLPLLKGVQGTDLALAYRDGRTGRSLALVLHTLNLGAEDFRSSLELAVEGVYEGLEFSANGTLGSIDLLNGGSKPYPIELQGKGAGISMSIAGTVAEPLAAEGLDLSISAEGGDLSPLAKATGKALPVLSEWRISGKLTGDGEDFSIGDLDAEMAENKVSGRLALDLKGARPAVKAKLASKRIDLGLLLSGRGKAGEKGEGPGRDEDGRVFSADPLPFDALAALDADLSLAVERLLFDNLTLEDLDMTMHLRNGKLKIAPARGKFAGGEVAADLSATVGSPPSIQVKADARQLRRGRLLKQFGVAGLTEGTVDLDANLKGSGDSVRQIMAGLDGRVRVVTKGGTIESSLLNFLAAGLKDLVPFFKHEGDDNISCGVADFDIDSGHAKSKALLLETGDVAIVGDGEVNLTNETPDIELSPRAKTISLLKLTSWRIHVGGTLASPSVTVKPIGPVRRIASGALGVARKAVDVVEGLVGDDDTSTTDELDPTDYCAKALAEDMAAPEHAKQPKSD